LRRKRIILGGKAGKKFKAGDDDGSVEPLVGINMDEVKGMEFRTKMGSSGFDLPVEQGQAD
jgi:hypothetical protein